MQVCFRLLDTMSLQFLVIFDSISCLLTLYGYLLAIELWLGTHVSGPSQVGLVEQGSLTFHPLGSYVASKYPEYQEGLPYLLKVAWEFIWILIWYRE